MSKNRIRARPRSLFIIILLLLIAVAGAAHAQGGVSVWLGAGNLGDESHEAYGAAQLDAPLIPVAPRAELLWVSPFGGDQSAAAILSGVYELGLPGISPYLIAGWGWYGLGEVDTDQGVSVGAGIRLGPPNLGVFGQIRRHQSLDETALSVGVTF